MGDRGVPRAEDGLAPGRHLAVAAWLLTVAAPVALAGCGSDATTGVTFRNDLPRPVQVGSCGDAACRTVRSWLPVDRGATATERLPAGAGVLRFVVLGPPDTVFGCVALRPAESGRAAVVRLSTARGCGSGR